MFRKKDSEGDNTPRFQDTEQDAALYPLYTQPQVPLRNDYSADPSSSKKDSDVQLTTAAPIDCSIAQRRFFSSDSVSLSRAKDATFTGKAEYAACVLCAGACLKANYSGHYIIRWRVKALEDFSIPNGLHFIVNVLYDDKHDTSGSLDVVMSSPQLSLLTPGSWYNLVLEEKLVVHPHVGNAKVEVILRNNENVDRDVYSGFAIEYVEIQPISIPVDPMSGIPEIVVPRAGMPDFSIDTSRVQQPVDCPSYISPSIDAPVTRLAASEGSRFMASLALSQDAAYITVWDMTVFKNPSDPSESMSRFYKSCAVAIVPRIGIGEHSIGLSIATNGDQVAIYQEPKIGQWVEGSKLEKATFPFKLFNNPMVRQPSVFVNMDLTGNGNVSSGINNIVEKSEFTTVAVDDTSLSPKEGRKQSSATTAAPSTPNEVVTLQEVSWSHYFLHTFTGFGKFLSESKKGGWEINDVNNDLANTNSKSSPVDTTSMFVACNGLYLDVFLITVEKRWQRIHTITLADLQPTFSRRIACKIMMESISHNTFMWLEDSGRSCTIWNLLTGSNITHISSDESTMFKSPIFRGHIKMAISPHESIVALASTNGKLTTYFVKTGMAIDGRKFSGYKIEHVGFHAHDDQLFVILRSSTTNELSARILDTFQLRYESLANQVPIPTIGSTMLAFYYSGGYWNRGLICEADGPKINCYASQPPTNKFMKNSEAVLTAIPDEVVYESSLNPDVQYRLMTGIHRELLPEGDGVSYWVVRVEVWEENLAARTQKVIFSFVPEPWMRVTTGEVIHPENLQSVFFVPGTNRFDIVRFAVVGMQTLQLWNLPISENSKCSLQFIWSQPRDDTELERGGIAYKSTNVRDYYLDTLSTTISLDTETGNTVAEIKLNDKSKKKLVSIPGPGTIGARYAGLFCFRSIHLLAAAYAFSINQSKKSARDTSQTSFTFEDHAEAIVSFTRGHINRMMSITAYSSSKKHGPFQIAADGGGEKDKPKKEKPETNSGVIPDSESNRPELDVSRPTVAGGNIAIHDSDNKWGSDAMSKRFHSIRVKMGLAAKVPPPVGQTRLEVVTLLTLLLDQSYLQETNHQFVEGLLNTANGDWIPRDNKDLNPIKRVIESRDGALVEAFVNYCLKNAKKYHPAYLMPVIQCVNELSDQYPSLLADMFRKASYVPVYNYEYVASHAVIANPQHGRYFASKLKFWRWFNGTKFEKSNNINDYEKPVFSLRSQLPFRAIGLLSFLGVYTSVSEMRLEDFPIEPYVIKDEKKKMIYVSPFPKLSMYEPNQQWFKGHESVKSAFTEIAGRDFFDSPAMKATLDFKWHKFGFYYWALRFLVVLIFFLLVILISAMQITTSASDDIAMRYLINWRPVFQTAIAFGLILIVYEFVQFLESPKKYTSSPYNYMDLAAYVMPVIGCILFLQTKVGSIDHETGTDRGPAQIWVTSFAILALYMNVLFELRVIKELGIVVNIILNITRRIVWFFLIFGLFLVSFTHALLHLMHTGRHSTCPPDGCDGSDYPDEYPRNFFGALAATCFFLAGRYDPISTLFDSGSTSFHIMMVIFFFFTAILLLNILIALMNDAFNESKDQGQLAWLKQLSEVISEVEIFLMSRGARQNRNYFPDYIYYVASEQEADLYESKFNIVENRFSSNTVAVEQNATQLAQRAILRDVQSLSKDIERIKQTQEELTNLITEFLAQSTKAVPPTATAGPNSAVLPSASPIENDLEKHEVAET
ncbi:hypothetical protein BGZ99_003622 [Dissophora globulifera]|uniref:Ion transport domain-containing protein n=1 Tax=Dissophora globulifera TaxID=979702 RepID=A0A9P6RKQ9_9FUNG|nr:hypothetical protein BGZ99_003622 [Dissophora globulifera]